MCVNLTASASLSSPPRLIFTQKVQFPVCFGLFWNIHHISRFQLEYLRWVWHVDIKSESNKCGSVTVTGLRPVLPRLSWIKCNITKRLNLLLYLHVSFSSVKHQKWMKQCQIMTWYYELWYQGSRKIANKRSTHRNLSLISVYCLKLIQKRFCWKHSLLLSF